MSAKGNTITSIASFTTHHLSNKSGNMVKNTSFPAINQSIRRNSREDCIRVISNPISIIFGIVAIVISLTFTFFIMTAHDIDVYNRNSDMEYKTISNLSNKNQFNNPSQTIFPRSPVNSIVSNDKYKSVNRGGLDSYLVVEPNTVQSINEIAKRSKIDRSSKKSKPFRVDLNNRNRENSNIDLSIGETNSNLRPTLHNLNPIPDLGVSSLKTQNKKVSNLSSEKFKPSAYQTDDHFESNILSNDNNYDVNDTNTHSGPDFDKIATVFEESSSTITIVDDELSSSSEGLFDEESSSFSDLTEGDTDSSSENDSNNEDTFHHNSTHDMSTLQTGSFGTPSTAGGRIDAGGSSSIFNRGLGGGAGLDNTRARRGLYDRDRTPNSAVFESEGVLYDPDQGRRRNEADDNFIFAHSSHGSLDDASSMNNFELVYLDRLRIKRAPTHTPFSPDEYKFRPGITAYHVLDDLEGIDLSRFVNETLKHRNNRTNTGDDPHNINTNGNNGNVSGNNSNNIHNNSSPSGSSQAKPSQTQPTHNVPTHNVPTHNVPTHTQPTQPTQPTRPQPTHTQPTYTQPTYNPTRQPIQPTQPTQPAQPMSRQPTQPNQPRLTSTGNSQPISSSLTNYYNNNPFYNVGTGTTSNHPGYNSYPSYFTGAHSPNPANSVTNSVRGYHANNYNANPNIYANTNRLYNPFNPRSPNESTYFPVDVFHPTEATNVSSRAPRSAVYGPYYIFNTDESNREISDESENGQYGSQVVRTATEQISTLLNDFSPQLKSKIIKFIYRHYEQFMFDLEAMDTNFESVPEVSDNNNNRERDEIRTKSNIHQQYFYPVRLKDVMPSCHKYFKYQYGYNGGEYYVNDIVFYHNFKKTQVGGNKKMHPSFPIEPTLSKPTLSKPTLSKPALEEQIKMLENQIDFCVDVVIVINHIIKLLPQLLSPNDLLSKIE